MPSQIEGDRVERRLDAWQVADTLADRVLVGPARVEVSLEDRSVVEDRDQSRPLLVESLGRRGLLRAHDVDPRRV